MNTQKKTWVSPEMTPIKIESTIISGGTDGGLYTS